MEETPAPPLVSVLIYSHNTAGALRRCLAALERSVDREKLEIIVADAGSHDESPNLDAEFPAAIFLRMPRNFGLAKALNIAMRTAKAELFLFLDARAEVAPETASALAAKLETESEAAAVCPLLVAPDGEPASQFFKLPAPETVSSAALGGEFQPAGAQDTGSDRVPVQFASLSALMVRAYFLKGLRYIDERYGHFWADAEIAFQIRRASRRILLFPALRVTLHPEELAVAQPAIESADWILGGAVYAGKHFGFAAGLKLRITAILKGLGQALFSLVRFRDPGYYWSRFFAVASGQKIDGTQGG